MTTTDRATEAEAAGTTSPPMEQRITERTIALYGHTANPEWRALIGAMLDRPLDHLAYLVAADWLEEHSVSHEVGRFRRFVPGGFFQCGLSQGGPSIPQFGLYHHISMYYEDWYFSCGHLGNYGQVLAWAMPILSVTIIGSRGRIVRPRRADDVRNLLSTAVRKPRRTPEELMAMSVTPTLQPPVRPR